MSSLVNADVDALHSLRQGLSQSGSKYASEADLLRTAIRALEDSSPTDTHQLAAEQASTAAAALESVGALFDELAARLVPEIDRLSALVELTRRT